MNFQFHQFVEGAVRRCILTEPGMAVAEQAEEFMESEDFMTDNGLSNDIIAWMEATASEDLEDAFEEAFEFDDDILNLNEFLDRVEG
jgi:hypothetical protein